MNLIDKLKEFQENKTKCFINGMPSQDGGVITKIEDDHLVFEVIKNADKQEKAMKETIFIPLDKIEIASEVKKIGTLIKEAMKPE